MNNVWDKVLSFESNELKRKVDPFRTVDLAGYLRVLPYLGAVSYLITLAIQQKLPELFNAAYPAAAAVIFIPIIFIILTT